MNNSAAAPRKLDVARGMNETLERWDTPKAPRYDLSLPELESYIRLRKGEGAYMTIAADPGCGKTAFALQIATAMSKDGAVGYYSFEIPATQLMDRLTSNLASIPYRRFQDDDPLTQDEQAQAATAIYGAIGRRHIDLIDADGMSADEVIKHAESEGYDVIVIDHIGNVRTEKGHSRTDEVTKVSAAFRQYRQRTGKICIVLSQLPKTGYGIGAKIAAGPKDASAIFEDSDAVVYLDRDKYQDDSELRQITSVIIAKNRHGECGMTIVRFDGQYQRFSEYPTEKKIEYLQLMRGKRQ